MSQGFFSMSSPRLAAVVLIVSSCASWDSSAPTYAAPPTASPTPSHHAPPSEAPPAEPVRVSEAPDSEPPAPPADVPEQAPPQDPPPSPPVTDRHAAIASVQLLEDCPEPAALADTSASPRGPAGEGVALPGSQSRSPQMRRGPRECEQSTVQLAVRSNLAGAFRIHAVRVLDATTHRKVGTTKLRMPTRWAESSGTYDAWDATLAAGADLNISYKLGELEVPLDRRGGPDFNAIMGPFELELDVTIAGKRAKIRSPEFGREPVRMGNIQT